MKIFFIVLSILLVSMTAAFSAEELENNDNGTVEYWILDTTDK